jgi:hypothetical protein
VFEEAVWHSGYRLGRSFLTKHEEFSASSVLIISRSHEGTSHQSLTPASFPFTAARVALALMASEAAHGRPDPTSTPSKHIIVTPCFERLVNMVRLPPLRTQFAAQRKSYSAIQRNALCSTRELWSSRLFLLILIRWIEPEPNKVTTTLNKSHCAKLHNVTHQLILEGLRAAGGGRLTLWHGRPR